MIMTWRTILNSRPTSNAQKIFATIIVCTSLLHSAYAGSGTWLANPVNNDWNNPANWSSHTVPGSLDTATLAASTETAISVSAQSDTFQIVFNSDAAAYQITAQAGASIGANNGGIINSSPFTQTFVAAADESGLSGTVGLGGGTPQGPITFVSEPRRTSDGDSGVVWITYEANAADASFLNEGGVLPDTTGGQTYFYAGGVVHGGNAANATILSEGGKVAGAAGGVTMFWTNSGAGNATITAEGASIAGAAGGMTLFTDQTTAENATLIAKGGTDGGTGAVIAFMSKSDGGASRIELFGDGTLDISSLDNGALTIGSLEGEGHVQLGTRKLTIGTNDLSTAFAGEIDGSGGVTKTGAGALTLTGVNSYSRGTTVSAGTLLVSNKSGSGTGAGAVNVNSGTLGGSGIISGKVTVGTGSGTGAFLAPAAGSNKQATLTIQRALIFNSEATYTYTFKAKKNKAKADKVVANGVTINGATLNLVGQTQGSLKQGLRLTLISNTSSNPISGTFSNLPDGGIVTINGNNFQASYEGGDGNDLTLTVVP
jgi:autotransporter-associated beta strand protein